ncbi:hypothetical protein Q5P01_000842 [Channa striata]|uniref:Uncharacterized protein n=1 Tax=Channa striata TaxID=64152 RepID=A0AA88LM80_CHASR|nr:hypothetical protein Q5P01_000842 [Channa striata]
METAQGAASLWKRGLARPFQRFAADPDRAIEAAERYELAVAAGARAGEVGEDWRENGPGAQLSDANMSTDDEYQEESRGRNATRWERVSFKRGDSSESMSEGDEPSAGEEESDAEGWRSYQQPGSATRGGRGDSPPLLAECRSQRRWGNWREARGARRAPERRPWGPGRCLRCEAYDATASRAENYRRTLNSYTKTVSELMIGFKTVLERYPELRVETSDERLHYMVQAALGRNTLVREMVRLAARRGHVRAASDRGEEEEDVDAGSRGRGRSAIASVCEALNSCYTDGEALRLILERYVDLYVRYVEVWREMCTKITRDISAMEFAERTRDRPGVSHGEPWSEARAYARKRLLSGSIEDVRDRLDAASSRLWSWDSGMNDLYFDLRSDLAILETLIGVGEISVKSLLYDRSVLVSQLRKIILNENTLELRLSHARSKLAESDVFRRRAEAKSVEMRIADEPGALGFGDVRDT